jgi:serine/threonine protein kinase
MGCVAPKASDLNPYVQNHDEDQGQEIRSDLEATFHREYTLGAKLGVGAFGQVRSVRKRSQAGRWNPAGDGEAVKIISLQHKDSREPSSRLQSLAMKEVAVWQAIGQHPHCVGMHNHFFGDVFYYVVMDKCDMSLQEKLDKMHSFTEHGLGEVVAQMLSGISHIHHVNVIHRDIKPDNFLVCREDGRTVKLTDFGLSSLTKDGGKVKGVFGTAPFMCPEMIAGVGYDTKADIWSCGVLIYTALFGAFPYTPKKFTEPAMLKAIAEGTPPSFCPTAAKDDASIGSNTLFRSNEAVGLVEALLRRDPRIRLSAEEALQEPWMLASLEQHHQPNTDLPCLHPMLRAAKRCGFFEIRDLEIASDDDILLDQMQRLSQKQKSSSDIEAWESTDTASTECMSSTDVSFSDQEFVGPLEGYGPVPLKSPKWSASKGRQSQAACG